MSEKYNKTDTLIYNTYQMYLKGGLDNLKKDIQYAKEHNYKLGAKVVRGAYIVHEKERASRLKIADPIVPSKHIVNIQYNQAVNLILENMDNSGLVVATHNTESVQNLCQQMQVHNILKSHPRIHVAQLMGMAEHLTLALAQNGYNVCKLLPFGPVQLVMPYLIRRMQENKDITGGTQLERQLLWDEILRRNSTVLSKLRN